MPDAVRMYKYAVKRSHAMDTFRRRYLPYFVALIILVPIFTMAILVYHTYDAVNVASVVLSMFALLLIGGLIVRTWVRQGSAAVRPPILVGQVLVLAALILFLGLAIMHIG
jgi:hypothetical protein